MFSLAYVILPFSDTPPADAIKASLARFERGGRGDVPDEWLRFDEETAHVEEVYRARITFTEGKGLRTEGADSFYLHLREILAEMEERGANPWTVRFADVEPDIAAFVRRYMPRLERHPVTGGFGQWFNGLGKWDWWDLGGRHDGIITGERGGAGRPRSAVSSGPSRGRDVLGRIEDALGEALDQARPETIDVRADNNVELVEALGSDLVEGRSPRLPGAVVLPPGILEDDLRWIANWPEIGPANALGWLGLAAGSEWRDVLRAVYARFDDHWAASVSFHL